MSTNEEMTIDEVYKYVNKMRIRYRKASKKEKSQMLNDMQAVTGRNRNYLIQLLRSPVKRKRRKRHRGRTYQADFDRVLKKVYESYGHICAERLHPTLGKLAAQLARHQEVELTEKLEAQLNTVSLSTVSNRLRLYRQDDPWTPRRPRRKPNPMLQDIPACRLAWDIDQPGYFEVDLVFHSGPSSQGEFVHTLQMIDVYSGWSERTAIMGRSQRVVEAGFKRIMKRLPFSIKGVHPDNGSEFFNHHMRRFWRNYPHIELSRSHPYRKNDNRLVEQKNSSLVRYYVGDIRLDTIDQLNALERIYQQLWLFNNCFQPVLRLIEKEYIPTEDGKPAKVKRKRSAVTAWQRICDVNAVDEPLLSQIQQRIDGTNPAKFHDAINAAIDALFLMPCKSSNAPENVFDTLSD